MVGLVGLEVDGGGRVQFGRFDFALALSDWIWEAMILDWPAFASLTNNQRPWPFPGPTDSTVGRVILVGTGHNSLHLLALPNQRPDSTPPLPQPLHFGQIVGPIQASLTSMAFNFMSGECDFWVACGTSFGDLVLWRPFHSTNSIYRGQGHNVQTPSSLSLILLTLECSSRGLCGGLDGV